MTVKLTLMFMSAVVGTFIGLILTKRLTRRRKYFEELILLVNTLIGDFRFKQNSVSSILKNFSADATKSTVAEFTTFADGAEHELKLSRQDMTKREYNVVYEMFSALGTYDLDTQVFMLDTYKTKLNEFYEAAKDMEARYGKVYIKLGFLFGLGLGLVLL